MTNTTISISEENHKLLTSIGKYGDSMDDIISRLLEEKGVKKKK